MKYGYLLFDLDGTLFDYDKAESDALKNTFFHFGFEYDFEFLTQYRELNHVIWQEFEKGNISQRELKTKRFDQLANALNLNFDSTRFSDNYLLNLSKGTSLLNGAEELLKSLFGKTKLYLITNGLTIVQRPRIKNSVIGKFFDGIIISEEVGFAKPQKEIFDLAFDIMDNPAKKEVLMIGDSLTSDIAGGINYGIDTCWYNPNVQKMDKNIKPTYLIRGLKQITEKVIDTN
jgi:2-haloacid dehalogenase